MTISRCQHSFHKWTQWLKENH